MGVACHTNIKIFDLISHDSENAYEGHTQNVIQFGFQKDNKWFFSASEDGTLKIFDFRASGFMRNYNNQVMINCAFLHPNQVEVFFGD